MSLEQRSGRSFFNIPSERQLEPIVIKIHHGAINWLIEGSGFHQRLEKLFCCISGISAKVLVRRSNFLQHLAGAISWSCFRKRIRQSAYVLRNFIAYRLAIEKLYAYAETAASSMFGFYVGNSSSEKAL
jgi:hypothetical protein